ncbi:serine hydrolase [Nocardioides litoris]|uniref:serine hydrolase n=1 Tax=Nocardioides litoris TaxID=1926648 RepID=UPI001122B420|nr:serine hydrolase [Nocardioides litoris]
MATRALTAVWLGGLDLRCWWEQDADEAAYAASLVKLPLATAAEALGDELDEPVVVHDEFDSAVAGQRFRLEREDDQDDATWDALGEGVTLRELRRRAVVDSSNIAANLLLEVVGVPAVQDVLRAAGTSARTTVTRGIGDLAAREAGLANEVTARDVARLLAATPPAVEDLMRDQAHRDGIPAGLPPGTPVANKTGWVDGLAHDAAVVRPTAEQGGDPFLLVVLVVAADDDTADEADLQRRVAAVAAEAWERRR